MRQLMIPRTGGMRTRKDPLQVTQRFLELGFSLRFRLVHTSLKKLVEDIL
jgi:hypothetical protein